MFRHQDFRDFHGCDRVILRPHPKITPAPLEHKPFLGFLLTRNQTNADGTPVYDLSSSASWLDKRLKTMGLPFVERIFAWRASKRLKYGRAASMLASCQS
jgi:hypothetical protein